MLEQGLVKRHFLGRDGFIWWIGQVVDQTQWAGNFPEAPTRTTDDHKGFDFRYKVRIMGYHTAAPGDLSDDDLPWASVMLPVTAGVSGGSVSTPNLRQGNFVYGFFMDGEDAQMPIIMGVLGYNQYTAVMKNVPDTGFLPFSGYTTKDQVPQYALPTKEEEAKTLSEDVEVLDANGNLFASVIDIIKPEPMKVPKSNIYYEDPLKEATRLPGYNKVGNIIHVYLAWRGKNYMLQMFFPHVKTPSRREVQDQVRKVYPGAKLWNYQVSNHDPGEPLLQAGG